ncbi:MAG: sulfatase [Actinomycetota bacterium]
MILANRRLRLASSLALLIAASVLVAPSHSSTPVAQAADPKPSVLFIITDDQRAETLPAMETVTNEIVEKGINFKKGFVSNPLCCPSRATALTGEYSHTNGVYRNGPPFGGWDAFEPHETSTLATWLDPTHETGLFGKYFNSFRTAGANGHVPDGWDRFVAFPAPHYYDYQLDMDGVVHNFGSAPADYSTNVIANEAVDFIEGTTEPVFVWFAPFAPHNPATPAPGDRHAFDDLPDWRPRNYNEADVSDKPGWVRSIPLMTRADQRAQDKYRERQFESLQSADRAIADILGALQDTGRLSNTLIVYTTDQGVAWGEHRWGHRKKVAWEEIVRVPFVVRFDPLITQPRSDRHLVVNIDFAPTIVDPLVTDVAAPPMDGTSLVPLFDDPSSPWRSEFLLEYKEKDSANNPAPPTYCGIRTAKYKYVDYLIGKSELYNLDKDPFELHNLIGKPGGAAVVSTLQPKLDALCSPPPP